MWVSNGWRDHALTAVPLNRSCHCLCCFRVSSCYQVGRYAPIAIRGRSPSWYTLESCGHGKRSPATGPLSWYQSLPLLIHIHFNPTFTYVLRRTPSLLAASSCPAAKNMALCWRHSRPATHCRVRSYRVSSQRNETVRNSHRSPDTVCHRVEGQRCAFLLADWLEC